MPDERVVELDLGVSPEAGVSGAVLLQSEESAVLLFNAIAPSRTRRLGDLGPRYEPAGSAAVTFEGLEECRFGGPNDEGRPEHPLYDKGMRDLPYAICEVLSSRWAAERATRNEATARRIWGERFQKTYASRSFELRHFVFLFHDSTFECLASKIEVAVSPQPVNELVVEHAKRLASE